MAMNSLVDRAEADTPVRVLMVTIALPTEARPGTTAFIARQIESIAGLGVEVTTLEVKGLRALKYLQTLPRLLELARSADVVHAHFGYCAWISLSQLRKPVVVSFLGDDLLGTPDASGRIHPLSRIVVAIDRAIARVADAVIVQSTEMARIVEPVPAHVIPNGIDLDAFRPLEQAAARRELGWSENARYVLFGGNPGNPRKGFPLARDAVAHASANLTAPVELVSLVDVPPDRVPIHMNGADVLLLTSFVEGSPNVVKEALACNVAVVSVPVGDVREMIADVAGCEVCPRDPAALGDALARRLSNPTRVDGRAALQRKGLDMETVAQRVRSVYADVLAKRAVARPLRANRRQRIRLRDDTRASPN
jgi:glycosyltransferase involved in cell wall biosynthesis